MSFIKVHGACWATRAGVPSNKGGRRADVDAVGTDAADAFKTSFTVRRLGSAVAADLAFLRFFGRSTAFEEVGCNQLDRLFDAGRLDRRLIARARLLSQSVKTASRSSTGRS